MGPIVLLALKIPDVIHHLERNLLALVGIFLNQNKCRIFGVAY